MLLILLGYLWFHVCKLTLVYQKCENISNRRCFLVNMLGLHTALLIVALAEAFPRGVWKRAGRRRKINKTSCW